MSEAEKEAIREAKSEIEVEKSVNCMFAKWLDIEKLQILLNYISKLQKENEELKKELEIFNGIKKGTTIMFGAKTQYWRKDKIEKYYISKNKIREQIPIFKKEGSQTSLIIVSVLEELLGDDINEN